MAREYCDHAAGYCRRDSDGRHKCKQAGSSGFLDHDYDSVIISGAEWNAETARDKALAALALADGSE